MTTDPTHTPKSRMADFAWKPLIMLAVVAAAFALVYFTPARKYLGNIQSVKYWLLSLGWVGPAAWMGIVFVLVAAGMPRLLFCPIGGLAFGFWHGLLWTQVATLAGYYALFLFVRWGGRDFVLRHWPRVGRLKEAFSRPFRGAAGLCRAPAPHQRADHQFSAGAVAHPTPPLSAGDGLRDSARGHPVHAGSQRHVQADRPKHTALHRRCGGSSPAGVRRPVVFLPPFKTAGRAARRNRGRGRGSRSPSARRVLKGI